MILKREKKRQHFKILKKNGKKKRQEKRQKKTAKNYHWLTYLNDYFFCCKK